MKTGIPMNGSMVKDHISLRRDSDTLQHGELRSDCGARFVKFIFWIVIDFEDTFGVIIFFTHSKCDSDPRTERCAKQ